MSKSIDMTEPKMHNQIHLKCEDKRMNRNIKT